MIIKIVDVVSKIYEKLYKADKIEIGNHHSIKLPNGKMLSTYADSNHHEPYQEFTFFSLKYGEFDFTVINGEGFKIEADKKDLDFYKLSEALKELDVQVDRLITEKRMTIDGKEYILVPVEE